MEQPPFISCCHLFASGKAAFAVHRTISRIYRHHRLVEHGCSSAMKSMVGHFTGDHCQARQDPAGGQEACYLEPRWFRTQRSVSLISWKPVAPRNTLLLLEMAFFFGIQDSMASRSIPLLPSRECSVTITWQVPPSAASLPMKLSLLKMRLRGALFQAVPSGHLTEKCLPPLDACYILYLL